MIWEQSLQQHLSGDDSLNMLGGRIHWDVAPPESSFPYLIIQQVSSPEGTTFDGSPAGSFPLVRFTVWAQTRLRANTIRRLLRDSIEGKEIGVASISIDGFTDHIDDSMKPILYGAILDARFHINNKQ